MFKIYLKIIHQSQHLRRPLELIFGIILNPNWIFSGHQPSSQFLISNHRALINRLFKSIVIILLQKVREVQFGEVYFFRAQFDVLQVLLEEESAKKNRV